MLYPFELREHNQVILLQTPFRSSGLKSSRGNPTCLKIKDTQGGVNWGEEGFVASRENDTEN